MSKLDGKRILLTGGTGSLGRAMLKRILSGKAGRPKSVTVFSRNEDKQNENKMLFPSPLIDYFLGDVQNKSAMRHVTEGKDIIIHTAAMKHVGNCTAQPDLAWGINVAGTENLIDAIRFVGVETVIGVSSDKGKAPENWYGRTKGEQERRILEANRTCPGTRFIAVCYGNVMASNGSVINKWHNQIKQGQGIVVNDPNMTRFLISLDQAVDTILAALEDAKRGEIYVPIIPAATVGDLAKVILDGRDLPISYTVKGADEKMHETLITEDEAERTVRRNGYFVVTRTIQDRPAISGQYVSRDYLIGKVELRKLLDKYGLLIEEKVVA